MTEVVSRIFVGNLQDCESHTNRNGFAVLHAAKSPCHTKALGYSGKLPQDHPNYLVFEDEDDLYLNIIDAPFPLDPKYGDPMFKAAFAFLEKHLAVPEKNILIHCNEGGSRAPSIALAFMAKKGLLSAISYSLARLDFQNYFTLYLPGKGIEHYLENHWNSVMSL